MGSCAAPGSLSSRVLCKGPGVSWEEVSQQSLSQLTFHWWFFTFVPALTSSVLLNLALQVTLVHPHSAFHFSKELVTKSEEEIWGKMC